MTRLDQELVSSPRVGRHPLGFVVLLALVGCGTHHERTLPGFVPRTPATMALRGSPYGRPLPAGSIAALPDGTPVLVSPPPPGRGAYAIPPVSGTPVPPPPTADHAPATTPEPPLLEPAPAVARTVDPAALARLTSVERATVRVIALHSVAGIEVGDEIVGVPVVRYGSGVAVGTDGLVLTAQHVVEEALLVTVWRPGQPEPQLASAVYENKEADFATLLVAGSLENTLAVPAPADVVDVPTRTRVFAFGYPEDLFETLPAATEGIISRQSVSGLYQISAAVNPGNSGGPLVDDDDHLLGIVVQRHRDAEGMGYALPISTVVADWSKATDPGAMDAQRLVLESSAGATSAEVALVNARWAVADSALTEGGWLDTLVQSCNRAVTPETTATMDRLATLAEQDASGAAALLSAAYLWNLTLCELARNEQGTQSLLYPAAIDPWLRGANPQVGRVLRAGELCRRVQSLNPEAAERSTFVDPVVRFADRLRSQVTVRRETAPPVRILSP